MRTSSCPASPSSTRTPAQFMIWRYMEKIMPAVAIKAKRPCDLRTRQREIWNPAAMLAIAISHLLKPAQQHAHTPKPNTLLRSHPFSFLLFF